MIEKAGALMGNLKMVAGGQNGFYKIFYFLFIPFRWHSIFLGKGL